MWEDYKRAKIFPGVPLGLIVMGILLVLPTERGAAGWIQIFFAACLILAGVTVLFAGVADAIDRRKDRYP